MTSQARRRDSGSVRLAVTDLDRLIQRLKEDGFAVWGPVRKDHAVVLDRIGGVSDLPAGWTAEQSPGVYRLRRRPDEAIFGYSVGPHSLKAFLSPPSRVLFKAEHRQGRLHILNPPDDDDPGKTAVLGVRACDLAAARFLKEALDQEGAGSMFVVAASCTQAAGVCFCGSMGWGPKPTTGFDLLLTEISDARGPGLIAEAGSEAGQRRLDDLDAPPATPDERASAAALLAEVERQTTQRFDASGVRDVLANNPEHPQWDDVATRCLACGNCTMVCPTCFCSTVEDRSDLTREAAERVQVWDSCFTMGFSREHGAARRSSVRSRYRQWLTHKFAHWFDQFGHSGCVGCGRCMTWCPVGIDPTQEVTALRAGTR